MQKVAQSALLVYVFDVIRTQPEEVHADLAKLIHENVHVLVVANKMDLNPYTRREDYFPSSSTEATADEKSEIGSRKSEGIEGASDFRLPTSDFPLPTSHFEWVPISAINNMNIGYLKEQLYEAVITKQLNLEGTIVANARHHEALQKAYESLDRVMSGLEAGVTSDFVAMDIRGALHYL
ncbi:MAG: hypothetical protein KDC75_27255, partial [Phaeodactylibacter sp.]|nr:hypothetical protein [Phaeodactylibacter sp.]